MQTIIMNPNNDVYIYRDPEKEMPWIFAVKNIHILVACVNFIYLDSHCNTHNIVTKINDKQNLQKQNNASKQSCLQIIALLTITTHTSIKIC